MQTVDLDARLSVAEAAEMAGVQATTIRKWDERGLIQPVGHDDRGHALYLFRDIVKAEQQTRQKGRPRKWQPQIPTPRELPAGAAEFLVRGAVAMAEFDNPDAAIRTALARLVVRGHPEGQPVRDLPGWIGGKTLEELRDTIIEIAIIEIAEREAGAIRPHRPRLLVDPDPGRDAFDRAV